MSTSASLRLASRRPASTPFVASPRLAAAMWTQPTSKLRTTSGPTQRTTDGDNTMPDELDSVRPPALPATETVLLECRPLRRGRPGARSGQGRHLGAQLAPPAIALPGLPAEACGGQR